MHPPNLIYNVYEIFVKKPHVITSEILKTHNVKIDMDREVTDSERISKLISKSHFELISLI